MRIESNKSLLNTQINSQIGCNTPANPLIMEHTTLDPDAEYNDKNGGKKASEKMSKGAEEQARAEIDEYLNAENLPEVKMIKRNTDPRQSANEK